MVTYQKELGTKGSFSPFSQAREQYAQNGVASTHFPSYLAFVPSHSLHLAHSPRYIRFQSKLVDILTISRFCTVSGESVKNLS